MLSRRARNILATVAACIAFLALFEMLLATAYYHFKYDEHSLAMLHAAKSLKSRLELFLAKDRVQEMSQQLPPDLWDALYTGPGRELLGEFAQRYETAFAQLVQDARAQNATLMVAYFPRGEDEPDSPSRVFCRPFFRDLANKHGVGFLDLTEAMATAPKRTVYLLPFDGHLSRYGNQLAAQALAQALANATQRRSGHRFDSVPDQLADLAPNQEAVWNMKPAAPFLLKTDRYGFRGSEDFALDTDKQKILALGDSITFGPYLPNHDTYTHFLGELLPGAVVMNAGVPGYTITDEASLFAERARYASPDIVLLQVFDNDLYGLFSFKMNEFDRKGRQWEPSEKESELLRKLRANSTTER